MTYIHELGSVLSSIFLLRNSFSLSLPIHDQYHASEATRSMARNTQLARAFTLIEVIVVLAIIVIMMSMVYPAYTTISERAKATKDMSNLRQVGIATQAYMNDSDGVLFSTNGSWMSQLYNADDPGSSKYLSAWNVFLSPFDHPVSPRSNSPKNANSALSYGINGTAGVIGMSVGRISKPTAFIVFAATQKSGRTVAFQGSADTTSQGSLTASPNVTVLAATSTPGGAAEGGTHNSRTRINALFADWHVEAIPWSGAGPAFTHTTDLGNDPDAPHRWSP
jgi:prepilin-type N-terminal cleavage/methylation domain-containing protein/prepilin-type processing-associated H-X9-DG protein